VCIISHNITIKGNLFNFMSIQFLRGTSQQRGVSNRVLSIGQPFYETDTNKQYIGDSHTPLCDLKPVSGNNNNIENSIGDGSLCSTVGNGTEDTRASGAQAIAFGKGCVAESSRALSLQRGNRVSKYITGYFYDASGAKVLDSYLSESTYSYATYDSQEGAYRSTDTTLNNENKETLFTMMDGGTDANACAAFGQLQQVAGNCSVAFGKQNKIYVNGAQSFVSGLRNRLDSYQSAVFGKDNSAIDGKYSQFIFGRDNVAKHDDATLIGLNLKSSPLPSGSSLVRPQTVVGRFNNEDTDALFIVGSGFSNDKRYNTFTVTTYGAYVKGEICVEDYIGSNGTVQATGIKINKKPVATEEYVNEKADEAKIYAYSKITDLNVDAIKGATNKTITSISQTNGKISASYSSIAFPVTSVAGKTGNVALSKSDVGLGNVANYSQTATPTSGSSLYFTAGGAYTELNKKADKSDIYTKSEVDSKDTTTFDSAKSYAESLIKSAFKWDASSGILTIDSTKIGG
jgi:hypothetical protein